jgi:hypothetical protein
MLPCYRTRPTCGADLHDRRCDFLDPRSPCRQLGAYRVKVPPRVAPAFSVHPRRACMHCFCRHSRHMFANPNWSRPVATNTNQIFDALPITSGHPGLGCIFERKVCRDQGRNFPILASYHLQSNAEIIWTVTEGAMDM